MRCVWLLVLLATTVYAVKPDSNSEVARNTKEAIRACQAKGKLFVQLGKCKQKGDAYTKIVTLTSKKDACCVDALEVCKDVSIQGELVHSVDNKVVLCDLNKQTCTTPYECTKEGVCCKKKSEGPMCQTKYAVEQKVSTECYQDLDCIDTEGTTCLKTGNHRHCCKIQKDYMCGEGVAPLSDSDGEMVASCENIGDTAYPLINAGSKVCCPRIYSESLSSEENKWESKSKKSCTTNSGCDKGEFCDQAIFYSKPKKESTSKLVSGLMQKKFCFPLPVCEGKVEKKEKTGIVTCPLNGTETEANTHCSANHFCDRHSLKKHKYGTAVCCKHQCKKSDDYAVEGTPFAHRKCIKDCVVDDSKASGLKSEFKAVCQETNTDDLKLCCDYQLKSIECPWSGAEAHFLANKEPCTAKKQCGETERCVFADVLKSYTIITNTSKSSLEGHCCKLQTCPNGIISNFERECDPLDEFSCGTVMLNDKPVKAGVCQEHGFCCPIVSTDKFVEYTFERTLNCTYSSDCGGYGSYCNETSGKCTYYGQQMPGYKIDSLDKCDGTAATTCSPINGAPAVCVIKEGVRQDGALEGHCLAPPVFTVVEKTNRIKTTYVYICIGSSVCCVIFGVAAMLSFLKYRSRHLCDRRKAKKDKKGKKKDQSDSSVSKTVTETGG